MFGTLTSFFYQKCQGDLRFGSLSWTRNHISPRSDHHSRGKPCGPLKRDIFSQVSVDVESLGTLSSDLLPIFQIFFQETRGGNLLFKHFKSRVLKVLGHVLGHSQTVQHFIGQRLTLSLLSLALQSLDTRRHLNLEEIEKMAQTLQDFLLSKNLMVTSTIAFTTKKPNIQEDCFPSD